MSQKIGIYNLHLHGKGGADKHSLVVADTLSKFYKIYLISNQLIDISELERYFDIDLSKVATVYIAKYPKFIEKWVGYLPARLSNLISNIYNFYKVRDLNLDIFINNTMGNSLPSPTKLSIYMCMFPHPYEEVPVSKSLIKHIFQISINWVEHITGWHDQNTIASYSVIASISSYTSEWIDRFWKLPSKLIYTVCEDMHGSKPELIKSKVILSVGRFSCIAPGITDKRHEILIQAFKQMEELHKLGWELHLAGSFYSSDSTSIELVKSLEESSLGYPIKFHFNLDFEQLKNLYQQSSIYWHGKGYGYSLESQPEKQEHFGISTVEAMSAGVVPITFNCGGQREVVAHGVDGFLWNDLQQLQEYTEELVNNPDLLKKLGNQAIASSKNFGRSAFEQKVKELVKDLLANQA